MFVHQPVLLKACIEGLAILPNGIYMDGTFGRGGHSRAILDQLGDAGRLIAIDKDEAAISHAKSHFCDDKRFSIVEGSFAKLAEIASEYQLEGRVNGILLDLGVSSPQLDDPLRGFSFSQSGPLDMRMDQTQALTAERFVNEASAADMASVFKTYGEERFARRIANAIVEARTEERIVTTAALAEIVKAANPKWEKHKHPATRVFQAIRIYVNQELSDLEVGLRACLPLLAVGGRLVVISFHSLEDRIVKQFMRNEEEGEQPPRGIPVKAVDIKVRFKRIGKAIKPHADEVAANVRSRSAVLRIGEKIA